MHPIRVVLIEDHRLAREQIAAVFAAQPDIEVVAMAGDLELGLSRISQTRPQVTVVDAVLDHHDSRRCVERIRSSAPETRVVVMNAPRVPEAIISLIQGGASGFITKEGTVADLVAATRSVAQGTSVLPPSLTSVLLSHLANHDIDPAEPDPAAGLTRREGDIACLIAEGLTNKEIAGRLNIATRTVKSHVHAILKKLALHTRVQIALCLRESGT